MQIDYANTPSQRYSQELLDTNWKLKADSIRIRDNIHARNLKRAVRAHM